ncbi:hypothetical protein KCP76_24655 [Salmonella enterica subsp. enterica serovar Weltevreden]|nr:hypothetical protein KCP76_24655 [Salmonella enterica subsp. enterica serovar Weltevreden]
MPITEEEAATAILKNRAGFIPAPTVSRNSTARQKGKTITRASIIHCRRIYATDNQC